jgi:phytoene/squalene synthetase
MDQEARSSQSLAAGITRTASKQTYYTIRFLADRQRVGDAFRAYAYFRWVDDIVDGEDNCRTGSQPDKIAFIERQKSLLEACYGGEIPDDLCAEERMLVDMIRNDTEKDSGLQIYLRNMMEVMLFDAERRGRVISQSELSEYSRKLAAAVTEAMYYFIGHDDPSPDHEARYLAVTAAHITHMLRDSLEDVDNGYFNIPQEVLTGCGISPRDVDSRAYREWVCGRIQLAKKYFNAGRECTARVRNLRCRLAGFAYTARFEWMLRAIERDHYCLRSEYPQRKSLWAGLWMGWYALKSMFALPWIKNAPRSLSAMPVRIEKP